MPEGSDLLYVSGGRVVHFLHDSGQGLGLQRLHQLRQFGPGSAREPLARTGLGDTVGGAEGTGVRDAGGL